MKHISLFFEFSPVSPSFKHAKEKNCKPAIKLKYLLIEVSMD